MLQGGKRYEKKFKKTTDHNSSFYGNLAKYAGLAWRQHQSGGFEAEVTRLIPSGNRFLKYYLCEAAFSLVRCDKEYSDFYHLKYKEVNRGQQMPTQTCTRINCP